MDALFAVPVPQNEPVRDYVPGSEQATSLRARLDELAASPIDLTMTIDGDQRMAGGERINVVQPHRHAHVLGVTGNATHADATAAIEAAKTAAPMWRDMSYADRAAIFLRAADLIAGPWRNTINGATMLAAACVAGLSLIVVSQILPPAPTPPPRRANNRPRLRSATIRGAPAPIRRPRRPPLRRRRPGRRPPSPPRRPRRRSRPSRPPAATPPHRRRRPRRRPRPGAGRIGPSLRRRHLRHPRRRRPPLRPSSRTRNPPTAPAWRGGTSCGRQTGPPRGRP